MDIAHFFTSVALPLGSNLAGVASHVRLHRGEFPSLEGVAAAIFGVKSGVGSPGNEGCMEAPDVFREQFYRLAAIDSGFSIADLGNIEAGATPEDTLFAVKESCSYLLKNKVLPIIIGGSQELTHAMYAAYEVMEHSVNLVTVDNKLDFGKSSVECNSSNYLNEIILHKPGFLFNYSNIANQRSLVNPDMLELMEKMYFDLYRLGEVSGNIEDMEPVIRNADIFSFDFAAIRASDAPGNMDARPNGLFAQEACTLCRYAGISDKLSAAGFFEYNPALDPNGTGARLLAELVWYFLEGFYLRKGDYPACDTAEYTRYIVDLASHNLVFYKSDKSDRWWMDVPFPSGTRNKLERHHLVPCTYRDYQTATNDELPDRWWRTYQKLV
jgi:arginase family enzyme